MKFPVLDFHCDTALQLLGEDRNTPGCFKKNGLHIDVERASTLPGYAQCFACFSTPTMRRPDGVSVIGMFERELAIILSQVEENSDRIRVAYSADEIESNLAQGIMSAVLTIEGTAGFDYNAEMLEDLYNIGFRITTLGWNEENPLTGSCKTGGGLTEQGREYVRQAQKVGMVIDVSHISDEGFWDIIDITEKPIIASHSNSRALCNIPRNLTDEMYAALCKTGGTVGINLCAEFLGKDADLDTVCDNILHFMDVAGSDKHVSLGSDMDGITHLPTGFAGVQDYPNIAERLLHRGLSEESVTNIFWNNAMGVIKKCSI